MPLTTPDSSNVKHFNSTHFCCTYQAFAVHDIVCQAVNGGMATPERTAAIDEFCSDPNTRVLLLSSVGSVGLNLTNANVCICFVSPLRALPCTALILAIV